MSQEKTEKATPKRRKELRKQGNVVQSPDITSSIVLLCIFGLLKAMGPEFTNSVANAMTKLLSGIDDNLNSMNDVRIKFGIVIMAAAAVLIPLLLACIAVSTVVTMAQTKLLVSPQALKFKFSKLNPINGLKSIFSAKGIVETLKAILKVIVIGLIMYIEITNRLPGILKIYNSNISVSLSWTGQLIIDVCIKGAAAFFIIGVGDYFFQWWNYERKAKMSKEEIKDEVKQAEGSPETKSRIKGEQRKAFQRRMMSAVPKASVVIRNPTHYAVALKYDSKKSRAPICVAKGQNNIALKIVEIAEANHVYVTENRPLAQALYKTVEVGQEIPEDFYKAVAEVLAYIYRLKRAGRG